MYQTVRVCTNYLPATKAYKNKIGKIMLNIVNVRSTPMYS